MTNNEKRVLVTGAAGYIGSHVISALHHAGFRHIWASDFAFGESPNTERIIPLVEGKFHHDLAMDDISLMEDGEPFDVIVHLAAYISVEESVREPGKYWMNNLLSTANMIRLANKWNAKLIFASTGTAFNPASPYAETKVECESLINDANVKDAITFRFYNVSGCAQGLYPTGEATHLIRVASNAAVSGKTMSVFGVDWDTADGSCVRDYIDVRDLAECIADVILHDRKSDKDFECLGSGNGFSVLEVLNTMGEVAQEPLNIVKVGRRLGDVGSMICPRDLIYEHLKIKRSLRDMCVSALKVAQT